MVQVSTSTTDITPKDAYLPCFVSGNPLRSEKTNKIHDRFECTVIVLKINKKLMVWGEIDIIEIDFKLADAMRKSIEKMKRGLRRNTAEGFISIQTQMMRRD